MRTIDKLEKIGPEKVRAILTGDFGVPEEGADRLLALLSTPDPMSDLEDLRGQNQLLDQGVGELSTVVGCLSAFGVRRTTSPWTLPSPGAWTTTPARSMRRSCWTTRRLVLSVRGAI